MKSACWKEIWQPSLLKMGFLVTLNLKEGMRIEDLKLFEN